MRSRFIPALAWSLAGAMKEGNNKRRIVRLRGLRDSIKLVMGLKISEPFNT
jgi:hypothetical protein